MRIFFCIFMLLLLVQSVKSQVSESQQIPKTTSHKVLFLQPNAIYENQAYVRFPMDMPVEKVVEYVLGLENFPVYSPKHYDPILNIWRFTLGKQKESPIKSLKGSEIQPMLERLAQDENVLSVMPEFHRDNFQDVGGSEVELPGRLMLECFFHIGRSNEVEEFENILKEKIAAVPWYVVDWDSGYCVIIVRFDETLITNSEAITRIQGAPNIGRTIKCITLTLND